MRGNTLLVCVFCITFPAIVSGQYPQGAHTNMYFPHLIDGGADAQKWQTTFIFMNPNPSTAANVTLHLIGDDGRPLPLDLGFGAKSELSFTIPKSGVRVFRSSVGSSKTVSGWATAWADSPVQATCLFRAIEYGVHRIELAAPPAVAAPSYSSFATGQLGIAIANVYSDVSVTVKVTAHNTEGQQVGQTSVTLPPAGHTAFNLDQRLPGLPQSFVGTVSIESAEPTLRFVGWTLNVDRGLIATLPSGAQTWPVSHWDEIWMAFLRVWKAAELLRESTPSFGFLKQVTVPELSIVTEFRGERLNAMANAQQVIITYGLAELISDSPSELGWVIAHELGHVIQRQTGVLLFDPTNAEFDADIWGFVLSLGAGYDPYAAAGSLAKLAMITGRSGLVQQFEDQVSADAHKSFNTRLDRLFDTMQTACAQAPAACRDYKNRIHPDFPPQAPLGDNHHRVAGDDASRVK